MIWQKGGNLGVLLFFFPCIKWKIGAVWYLVQNAERAWISAALKARSGGKEYREESTFRRVEESRSRTPQVGILRAEASSSSGAILPCLHLCLTLGSNFWNMPSRFTPVQARVGTEAVRTGHLWASWILGFLWNTDARGFSASFFSNIAMLPISLVTFSRSHQRCMLPPSLIASLLHFYLSLLYSRKLSYLQFINSLFSSI